MKSLKYPFTYEEWLKHPTTKPKLKWINETCDRWRLEKKYGEQSKLELT